MHRPPEASQASAQSGLVGEPSSRHRSVRQREQVADATQTLPLADDASQIHVTDAHRHFGAPGRLTESNPPAGECYLAGCLQPTHSLATQGMHVINILHTVGSHNNGGTRPLTFLLQNERILCLSPQTRNSPITAYNCFRCGITLLQCLAASVKNQPFSSPSPSRAFHKLRPHLPHTRISS